MFKSKFLQSLALGIASMTLIASNVPAARAADPVTLQVWLLTDNQTTKDQIAADFNASHTDIQVKFSYRAVDAHKEALRQVLNTDAVPDVFFNWGASGLGLGGALINAGGVEPIQRYFDKYQWSNRFSPAEVAASTLNGKLYAMPFAIHDMGLFYSKSVFQKAGITKDPTTYAELQADNDILVKAGITPLETGGKFGWMPMRLIDSLLETECGAAKHDALKAMTADWSSEPCVTAAFTDFKTWVDKGWLNKDFLSIDPTTADVHAAVYQGNAAYYYEGEWIIPALTGEGMKQDDLGFVSFPTGINRVSFFTEGLFMASNSKHKDEAAVFLDWISSPDVQQKYQSVWGGLSPTLGLKPAPGSLVTSVTDAVGKAQGVYIPSDQSLPLNAVNIIFRVEADLAQNVIQPQAVGAEIQDAINSYQKNQQAATAAPTVAATPAS